MSRSSLHVCRLVGWFVERSFFEDEPTVSAPENQVEKPENLPESDTNVKHACRDRRKEKTTLHTRLTTDAFKRPMRGTAPGVHLLLISLQTARKVTMVAGLVAVFTSDRPFAQAEDDVSHRKAKAEVSRRSWEINNTKSGLAPQQQQQQQLLMSGIPGLPDSHTLETVHLHNCAKWTFATFLLDSGRRRTPATPMRWNIV